MNLTNLVNSWLLIRMNSSFIHQRLYSIYTIMINFYVYLAGSGLQSISDDETSW